MQLRCRSRGTGAVSDRRLTEQETVDDPSGTAVMARYLAHMDLRSITPNEALELIERQESHFWDQKSLRSRGSVIQKIAVALGNADGGEFIVGVEDARAGSGIGRWVGFTTIEDATPVVEAVLRDVRPILPNSIEFLTVTGSQTRGLACLVMVGKSESVHRTSDGKAYLRRGATSVELTGQEATDLSLAKGARTYEDQLLADYDATDLVDEPELAFFLKSYSPATDAEDFLKKQRLIDRDTYRAKVAAAVLYASNPPAVVPKRCGVKIARYETKVENPIRQHLAGNPLTVEGPARLLIDKTLIAVTKLIESVQIMQTDGSMAPMHYPPEALKEIVVNAVIHRDFNVSDDILVYVFDNRVEVRSPGVLPGNMSTDKLLTHRFSRNPTIVRLLNKYPDPPNKDIGEGLQTVVSKMAEAKLKAPSFSVEGNYFVVKLGHTPLARPETIVLEYLQSHDEITNSIGRGLTGITSENTMKEVFYTLRDTGKLERVPGKAGSKSAWRNIQS